MNFIYNIGIRFTGFILKCIAPFNKKIKQGVRGRSKTFKQLEEHITPKDKVLWFHCASLGEYEQGLPVFEALRAHYKTHKIVLSFFSPSGYTIRKNTPIADVVVYLPMDSTHNAGRFIDFLNPELSIFVKYDIWPNYLQALKQRNLKAILISAAFRKPQIYFKPYGRFFKNALFAFQHIFTQNKASQVLLESIGYNATTVTGDTRYDRVSNQLTQDNILDFVAKFKTDKLCIVVGSSWPEDHSLFLNFINANSNVDVKYIIAPHAIKANQIETFRSKLNAKTILFSELETDTVLKDYKVLVIDTIGLLSKIYSYADIAYVGGAMGTTGLHNTLEPAVFGVPIIIGNNYDKFPEAKALIENGGMFAVKDQSAFNSIIDNLISKSDFRLTAGSKNKMFVEENKGAVIQILDYLRI